MTLSSSPVKGMGQLIKLDSSRKPNSIGPDIFDPAGLIYPAVMAGEPGQLIWAVSKTVRVWTPDYFPLPVGMCAEHPTDGGNLLTHMASAAAQHAIHGLLTPQRKAGYGEVATILVPDYGLRPNVPDNGGTTALGYICDPSLGGSLDGLKAVVLEQEALNEAKRPDEYLAFAKGRVCLEPPSPRYPAKPLGMTRS
jgi:hypothetical protein